MNQNPEFSKFVDSLQDVVYNGREESKTLEGSLERMIRAAIRQGRKDDVKRIAKFLEDMSKERAFFRKADKIVASDAKTSWRDFIPTIKRPVTPSTFEKTNSSLPASRPFRCYEGFFKCAEEGSGQQQESLAPLSLKGPYLLAVAANFSEYVALPKGNLVCLFSQATKSEKETGIELRIWNVQNFAPLFKGKSFDKSALSVPPDSNETILEVHKGQIPELFKIAVQKMVIASLSRDPPADVADKWFDLLREYGGISSETITLSQADSPAPI